MSVKKFESWSAVVEHYGEYGQPLDGETAEGLADAALASGEIEPAEEGYLKR